MNKVIKFRAYTEISNEVLGMKYDVPHTYNDTVMQFTGLLDRNGKEIYEGDVIRAEFSFIDFCEGCLGYQCFYLDEKDKAICHGCEGNYMLKELEDIKIIGNIYENPELLKS